MSAANQTALQLVIGLYRFLFAREFFYPLNKLLFALSARGLGLLNFEDERASGESHLIRRVLPRLIRREEPVVFDVGANVGSYAAAVLDRFPRARVHAFEPHPATFITLERRDSRIVAHRLALGETRGTVTLYDRNDCAGSQQASIYGEVISELYHQDPLPVEVPIDTIDNVVAQQQIEFVDFLKIDTEGHELAVLKGASQTLACGKIGCIHFEFNEMNVVSRVFFRDFRMLLAGYKFFRLLPSGLLRLGENPLQTELFAYQNILAVKADS